MDKNKKQTLDYQYRAKSILMANEIGNFTTTILHKLAFILSLQKALKGKDKFSDDERFNYETYEIQEQYYDIYEELFLNPITNQSSIEKIIKESKIIPINLYSDIQILLSYIEDQQNISQSVFAPLEADEESFAELTYEFYLRLLTCLRTLTWLEDIELGIEAYGVNCYKIPEDDSSEAINVLDGILDMKEDELLGQILILLGNNEMDNEDITKDKFALLSLIKTFLRKN